MLITTFTEVSIKLITGFSLIASKLIKFLGVFAYIPLGRYLYSFKLKVGRKNIRDKTTPDEDRFFAWWMKPAGILLIVMFLD